MNNELQEVIDNLTLLANRWREHPEWHDPLFVGKIDITTLDLGDLSILLYEFARLKRKNKEMRQILENIVNSAVHPDIAVRVFQVPLGPIREVLKDVD